MDFTLIIYYDLIHALKEAGYEFQTFEDFISSPKPKAVVLRHDVDMKPFHSLQFAKIQHHFQIKGTYYFRIKSSSYNKSVIKQIVELGHEIGYHYECLTTSKGDLKKGIKDFENNLKQLREFYPVKTICMHGSPLSKFDSKDLWKAYNYQDYGIIAEPYFDVDFNKVLYLTDTGRRWDGTSVSVRDKVNSEFKFKFKHTQEIISAIKKNKLPDQILFTFHPQRWNKSIGSWAKELAMQNFKNSLKYILIQLKK